MKYYIKTFGCQMNYADSERIKTIFNSRGLEEADEMSEASYIVFNSCAVKKNAEDKLYGHGKQVSEYKREKDRNYPITIMTGCIVKAGIKGKVKRKTVQEVQRDILNKVEWLDHAVPTKHIFRLLENLLDRDQNVHNLKKNLSETNSDTLANAGTNQYLEILPTPYSDFQASLPISVGCNHHCTFCTVPFSRGEETFRSFESIKEEYEKYVNEEYKQITLLGQTVNKWLNPKFKYHPKAYGWYRMGEILPDALDGDGSEPDNFLTLIKSLDSINPKNSENGKSDYWLNFVSSYPNYFTDDLIQCIVESINSDTGHITPIIHLAVQSGSDKVLKDMYRHYSVDEFKEVVQKFRDAIPDISITTDIIVGYTTETEEDFQMTLDLVEEIQFDMIYISEYSVRPDTPAGEKGDDVPKEEKRRRKDRVNEILERRLIEKNKEFIGQTHKILVTTRHHNNLVGKNKYGKDVEIVNPIKDGDIKIKDAGDFIGKFLDVEITEAGAWGMKGRLV